MLPLRPMTVSDLLDGAFRGLRATFGPVALLVLVLIAPVTLISNLVLARVAPWTFEQPFGPQFEAPVDDAPMPPGLFEDVTAFFGVAAVVGLVTYVLGLLISAAVIALVLDVDRGRPSNLGSAARGALRVFLPVLGASLLLVLGGFFVTIVYAVVSVLLLLVPVLGIILFVVLMLPLGIALLVVFFASTSLVVPIAVTEGTGVLETLGRVVWVLKVRFWRVVGVTLLVGLLILAITAGLQFGATLLAAGVPAGDWVIVSVSETATQLISIPVSAFVALLIYLDARIRFEGLDVQLRARGLGPS